MGKTRLGLAVAERQLSRFLDGIFFVALAPLSSPDDIVTTIAEQVGLSFSGNVPPKAQLLEYFRERHILLVLDNFEHLLAGAPLVSDLLQAAPAVKVLATARENSISVARQPMYSPDYTFRPRGPWKIYRHTMRSGCSSRARVGLGRILNLRPMRLTTWRASAG